MFTTPDVTNLKAFTAPVKIICEIETCWLFWEFSSFPLELQFVMEIASKSMAASAHLSMVHSVLVVLSVRSQINPAARALAGFLLFAVRLLQGWMCQGSIVMMLTAGCRSLLCLIVTAEDTLRCVGRHCHCSALKNIGRA